MGASAGRCSNWGLSVASIPTPAQTTFLGDGNFYCDAKTPLLIEIKGAGLVSAKKVSSCGAAEKRRDSSMETNLQIDFQGDVPIHGVREKIAGHVARLEERFGRITAGRVVVKRPSDHHRIGAYEINVRLMLPQGREVNVARTPDADERYCDIDFAVQDAFKRARRQLQDHARRLQGQVKTLRGRPRDLTTS